jgi:putative transposase
MHQALLLIATAIRAAHDRWRVTVARTRSRSAEIAVLEERVQRLEAENALLRARFGRLPPRRRPHYRPAERLEILWHAARYGLSLAATARAFVLSEQVVLNWRRIVRRKDAHLLPPLRRLSALVDELVFRMKAEWPAWGTRRIAGQLARLSVKASRTSVQRILRRRPPSPPARECATAAGRVLLAKHPGHVWMIDFTKVGGVLRPLWIGAAIDAFSRKVLAVGVVSGAPSAALAVRLLRRAIRSHGAPTWLVTDQDTVLRGRLVNALLARHHVRRRYGAVGRSGSIAIIERLWRSMKGEYVRHLFLFASAASMERRVRLWVRWYNAARPHQGLGQRTPDEVFRRRPPKRMRDLTSGTLSVRFLDGDHRLPILRLRRAA